MTINQIPGHPNFGQPFPRGATPTPHRELRAMPRYSPRALAPTQSATIADYLSFWDNDVAGCCVTTESAHAKSCYQPNGIIISDAEVKRWAQLHGVYNGADLGQVSDAMAVKGFVNGSQVYNEGPKSLIDITDEVILQSAIAETGVVKIAIAANALPSGAGNVMGWYTTSHNTYRNTDHCVSLSAYGPAGWLYQQLAAKHPCQLPAGLPADTFGYILFTWGGYGFVTWPWLKGTMDEAMARHPTTIGVPPLTPPPAPVPVPAPPLVGSLYVEKGTIIRGELSSGKFSYVPTPDGFTAAGAPKFKFIQLAE